MAETDQTFGDMDRWIYSSLWRISEVPELNLDSIPVIPFVPLKPKLTAEMLERINADHVFFYSKQGLRFKLDRDGSIWTRSSLDLLQGHDQMSTNVMQVGDGVADWENLLNNLPIDQDGRISIEYHFGVDQATVELVQQSFDPDFLSTPLRSSEILIQEVYHIWNQFAEKWLFEKMLGDIPRDYVDLEYQKLREYYDYGGQRMSELDLAAIVRVGWLDIHCAEQQCTPEEEVESALSYFELVDFLAQPLVLSSEFYYLQNGLSELKFGTYLELILSRISIDEASKKALIEQLASVLTASHSMPNVSLDIHADRSDKFKFGLMSEVSLVVKFISLAELISFGNDLMQDGRGGVVYQGYSLSSDDSVQLLLEYEVGNKGGDHGLRVSFDTFARVADMVGVPDLTGYMEDALFEYVDNDLEVFLDENFTSRTIKIKSKTGLDMIQWDQAIHDYIIVLHSGDVFGSQLFDETKMIFEINGVPIPDFSTGGKIDNSRLDLVGGSDLERWIQVMNEVDAFVANNDAGFVSLVRSCKGQLSFSPLSVNSLDGNIIVDLMGLREIQDILDLNFSIEVRDGDLVLTDGAGNVLLTELDSDVVLFEQSGYIMGKTDIDQLNVSLRH